MLRSAMKVVGNAIGCGLLCVGLLGGCGTTPIPEASGAPTGPDPAATQRGALCVSPSDALDFGDVVPGSVKRLPLTLRNCGTADMNLAHVSIASDAPEFRLLGAPLADKRLAVNEELTIYALFLPPAPGAHEVAVAWSSDAGDGQVALRGNGSSISGTYPVTLSEPRTRSIYSGRTFTGGCTEAEVVAGSYWDSTSALCSEPFVHVGGDDATAFSTQLLVGPPTTRPIYVGRQFTGGCLPDEVVSRINWESSDAICSRLSVRIGNQDFQIHVGPRMTRAASARTGGCHADEVASGIDWGGLGQALCSSLTLVVP